jgi:uncharacterized membrane protein YozB (DUF420 family)
MSSLTIAQSNLAFQIVILAVICMSLLLRKMHKYFLHGTTMLAGVILNGISFLRVMGPSLLNYREFILANMTNKVSLALLTHGVLGGMAEILAVVIVVFWGLRPSTRRCAKNRKLMQATLILWLIALALGILLFFVIYTSVLG